MKFSDVLKPFVWIGKEVAKAAVWVPRLIRVADDVKADAVTLLPELGAVIDDSGLVVAAAVKDSGAAVLAAESLIAAIASAASAKLLNISEDEAVATAFQGFIKQVTTSSNYTDLLGALKQLVTDYDKLGASVKTALATLEQDAKS